MNVINLTAGLAFERLLKPDAYSRLQSSHLEGGHWQRFIDSVDNNMLYALAMGEKVYVCDCGTRSKNGVPRTIWQGIPLIKACCELAWGLDFNGVQVKEHDVSGWYASLKLDLRKYRYFHKYLATDRVRLVGRSFRA